MEGVTDCEVAPDRHNNLEHVDVESDTSQGSFVSHFFAAINLNTGRDKVEHLGCENPND